MSFVITAPETLTAAASDLANLGSTISEAHAAAAVSTTELLPAAADEVSAQITALFGGYAQKFHAVSAQAAAFHAQFVQALNAGAGSYATTEAANISPLQTVQQDLLGVAKVPTQTLLSSPLIGNVRPAGGAPAATGLIAPLHLPPRVTQVAASVKADLANLHGAPGLNGQEFPVTGPVKLVTNTSTNLKADAAAWHADPFPILRQIIANQVGYAHMLNTALATISNNLAHTRMDFPAVLRTTEGFLRQGHVFEALTYLFNQTFVTPLIDDVGLPLLGPLHTILGDVGTHISNVLHDELALLSLALAPLYAPNAAVAALAGVSQDTLNALRSGHFLTAFQDIALAPTTVLGGFLNGYPVSAPNLTISPAGGLLTGVPGSSEPGFGSVGNILQALDSIAKDLGAKGVPQTAPWRGPRVPVLNP
jgi:hypothetical protein